MTATLRSRALEPPGARRIVEPEAVRLLGADLPESALDSATRDSAELVSAESASGGIKQHGWFANVLRRDEGGRLGLAPAYPLWALLVLFPLWWALGLGTFIFPILAVPMAVELVRSRRTIRFPRGWALWAMFVAWVGLSLVMYLRNPVGVHAGSLGGRLIATSVLVTDYAGATVTLLFIGNLSPTELPIPRLVRWLGTLFLVTVSGGLLGTLFSHFSFTSPVELLLPGNMRTDPYISALFHPAAAQVQNTLGSGESGRASAPFAYTNFWANNLSILLVWFVCGWGVTGSLRRRIACVVVVTIAAIPIIESLNRGLWIGIGFSLVWVVGRLFLHGKIGGLLALIAVACVAALVFVMSPLHATLSSRVTHPESNSIRSFLTTNAIDGAKQSPMLGWGGTRKTNGSAQSIAVGKSPVCAQCGDFTIGSNGQLWAVLFYQGFVGAVWFFGFFAACLWIYRRDGTPVGQAGVLAVALTFIYMFVYNSTPAALTVTMISVGLLWRSQLAQENTVALLPGRRLLSPASST
jgi:hypothetical protein